MSPPLSRPRVALDAFDPRRISVYVHFPWCARKCPYCDFATRGVPLHVIPHARYADAVLRELAARRTGLGGERVLSSVFFGGGTPSLWETSELGRALGGILGAFEAHAEDLEVTVECNPNSFDDAKAAGLAAVGVDRVSLGVQSLDDERLRFLGRLHDVGEALRAIRAATTHLGRVSADLMFGSPGQDADALRGEVARLLETGVRHVSAYALTIEPDTHFGALYRDGKLRVASDDDYAAMFETAERAFAGQGLAHYEISNYAAPGEESRHNLHYWRGGDYLGLGAAAVGCVRSAPGRARRWRNEPEGMRYVERVEAGEARPEVETEALDADAILREALMLGLRTAEGVRLDAAARRAGRALGEGREGALRRATARGQVVEEAGWLRVPRAQWFALDGIVAGLF